MDSPRRIVVLDDDARVRQLVRSAFKPPEFEVHAFADGRDALMKLHAIRPDLILSDVWMPDVDGRVFLQVVKRSPLLKDVPFVFLTAVRADAAIEAALQAGADGFLMKPFPLNLLVQKVRAMLGMSLDDQEVPPSHDAQAPSAREGRSPTRPAEPSDSREAGAPTPALSGEPRRPPEVHLDTRSGGAAPFPAGRYLPAELEGRFTIANVGGRKIPVLTEAENRPNFTVTTYMTSNGRPMRKIETSWHHPLERREDLVPAQRQIRLQHDQALAALEQLGLSHTPRRVVWDVQSRLVNGTLLCWALAAVFEEARARLGAEPALSLLRRNFDRLSLAFDALRLFRVTDEGRVVLDRHGAPLVPQAAVVAAAEWAVAFVAESSRVGGKAAAAAVRRTTAAKGAQLERIGFDSAVALAARRVGPLSVSG